MEEAERRVLNINDFGIESRTITRADGQQQQVDVIVGKATPFNQYSQLLGWFKEQIVPAAFDSCDMSDVVCLKNHDNNLILGRTADTLTLEVRADGLYFVAYPPNTQTGRDTLEEIRSKMIKGCSFQFSIAPGGSDWDTDPETGVEIRTIKKIAKLYDVGPVTFPAYLQTNTDAAKRDHESASNEKRMKGMGKKKDKKEVPTYDETFIADMIPHHQMAIEMANEALGKVEHQELKDLAQTIIDTQTDEIAKMEKWKGEWFAAKESQRQAIPPPSTENQQDSPASTVAPLSVYKRKLQLLNTVEQ